MAIDWSVQQTPAYSASKMYHDAASDAGQWGVTGAALLGKAALTRPDLEAKNMADCLRQKRTKQREYKNPDKREKVIAGGSKKKFIMKCDKVDAEVEIKEDGTWHIIKILGRNKAAYAKKKAWEKHK